MEHRQELTGKAVFFIQFISFIKKIKGILRLILSGYHKNAYVDRAGIFYGAKH